MPSLDWHSIRTNVLRRRIRWSISSCVSWRWCLSVSTRAPDAAPGPQIEAGRRVATALQRTSDVDAITLALLRRPAICLGASTAHQHGPLGIVQAAGLE